MVCGDSLGAFLRARREATTPAQVGLRAIGPRRTPGLRRDELAMLADISTDYYTRLEQGRERHPSDQVLEALARALDLGPDAVEYLHELAHPRPSRQGRESRAQPVHPNVLRLIASLNNVAACVVNQRLDVLAVNAVAAGIYEGLDHRDNLLRLPLLNPAAREFYLDWEKDTYLKVAHLRTAEGANPDDPSLLELVDELSRESEDFRRLWNRHEVEAKVRAPFRFHHHRVGDVVTTVDIFSVDSDIGQKIVMYQAESGSPSEHALALLSRPVRGDTWR